MAQINKNEQEPITNKDTPSILLEGLPKKKEEINLIMWKALYLMVDQYPNEPTIETIDNCRTFIHTLPYMLPTDLDGYYLKSFIINYTDNNPDFCDSQKNMAKFFVDAYNNQSI